MARDPQARVESLHAVGLRPGLAWGGDSTVVITPSYWGPQSWRAVVLVPGQPPAAQTLSLPLADMAAVGVPQGKGLPLISLLSPSCLDPTLPLEHSLLSEPHLISFVTGLWHTGPSLRAPPPGVPYHPPRCDYVLTHPCSRQAGVTVC
jgi:hypothetical protein